MTAEHRVPDIKTLTKAPLRHRLRVSLRVKVDAVWEVVGDLSRMPEYSAGLARVDVERGTGGVPARFVCHFKPTEPGGAIIVHPNTIPWYKPKLGWASADVEPNDFGLTGSVHLVTLQPSAEGTLVTWIVHYNAPDLDAQRTGLDLALADIGERLVTRFGGEVVERYLDVPRSAVDSEVIQAVERMTDAFHRADIDAVLAAYEPDAVVTFMPGQPVTGRNALREGFEMFFGFKPKFEYGGHEVLVSGDTAIHLAPWTMAGTGPDGAAMSNSGLSVALLRRGHEGQWRLVIDNPYGARLLGTL